MPRLTNRRAAQDDDEGFYVSMSDMLTGLLFIFIILLVYYAVQARQVTQELTGANAARKELLEDLQRRLAKRNITVEIDPVTGVLRLDDAILFSEASASLTERGVATVNALADVLIEVLPCYTDEAPTDAPCLSTAKPYRIDALFVEGHSDKRRFMRGGEDTNIELSANRAINTFKALVNQQNGLNELRTKIGTGIRQRPVAILSVSGYGGTRPVFGREGFNEADFAANRRIDLRFLMATPDASRFENMLQ
jgi:flagellar motor protein MotB